MFSGENNTIILGLQACAPVFSTGLLDGALLADGAAETDDVVAAETAEANAVAAGSVEASMVAASAVATGGVEGATAEAVGGATEAPATTVDVIPAPACSHRATCQLAGLPEQTRTALAAHNFTTPNPVDATARRMVEREVLTAGMPLAAMPVESLYKPWTSLPGSQFGGTRGLYMGDAARHVQVLYEALQLEIPQHFAAMPDHLSLLCELLALYLEAENYPVALQLVQDHFDWLHSYDAALAARAQQAAEVAAFNDEGRAALVRGIAHVRACVALVGELAERVMHLTHT